jgi:hypothetical protein
MLLLIIRRWPRTGAALSVLTNIAFVAAGVAIHSMVTVLASAAFLALSVGKSARRFRGTRQARP